MHKYAVVDIGTNSVRLMIARVDDGCIVSEYKTLRTIRVGEGMSGHRSISSDAMKRAQITIDEYIRLCADCDNFFCFATSAVRDAQNSREFAKHIESNCGVTVDVISGEDEALLGFAGSIVGYGGMFDIGGGSTEVMTGTLNNVEYKRSFDLGAVRLLQMFPSVDFADCDAYEQAHALASEFLANVPPADGFAYTGIGGTATAIAAIDLELVPYDAKRVQGHMISFERACSLCDMLKNKTKKQREKIDSLQDSRADVIVLGAIIMLEFMKASKSSYITVSDSDNQEGYLKKKLGLL